MVLFLSFLVGSAPAAELLVPSGLYPTVQDAVSAAGDGDVILVTESVAGQVDVNDKDIVLQGLGFDVVLTAGSGPVLEIRGDSVATVRHLTVDGEGARQAVELREQAVVTLDAVKVMRGVEEGGGIEAHNDAVVTLTGSLVCGGQAPSNGDHGGGLRAHGASRVDVVDSVFFANDADARGGALRFEEPGSVVGSTLYANTADRSAALSVNGNGTQVTLSDSVIWANANRVNKKNPPVVNRSSGGSTIGGDNIYFDNSRTDTDNPLPGDSFGVDPELTTVAPDCLTAVMGDFTAETGGLADTLGAGAVGADLDGDGVGDGPDCDDGNDLVFPGAVEAPADGVDQNCDGVELCYIDTDGDGAGDPSVPPIWTTDLLCAGDGLADNMDDCNDGDPSVYGGAPEVIDDGIDQDCFEGDLCFEDVDEDGYGSGGVVVSSDLSCDGPGEAPQGTPLTDCDDDDDEVNPGAIDVTGDGVDSDCDDVELCYVDADNDTYSDIDLIVPSVTGDCTGPEEGLLSDDDCNDDEVNDFPGAPEQCDGEDNDCDGVVDEDVQFTDWYPDVDGDGFGADGITPANDCEAPPGTVSVPGDCDDFNEYVSPGFPELPCDGVDNDCDPKTPDDDGSCNGETGDTGTVVMDTDTDVDTDTDTDTDTDVDTDVDTDTDTDADTEPTGGVQVGVGGTATTGCACDQRALRTGMASVWARRR